MTAERGVTLVTEYNNLFTKNEKQQQALFLTVNKHRKMLPDMKKIPSLNRGKNEIR